MGKKGMKKSFPSGDRERETENEKKNEGAAREVKGRERESGRIE